MDLKEFHEKFKPHDSHFHYIFLPDKGYITWHIGTGGNVELSNLRVFEKRKGYATELVTRMAQTVKSYHSIYVFVLKSNKVARIAYESFGFKFTEVPNLYKHDGTLIGTVTQSELLKRVGGA